MFIGYPWKASPSTNGRLYKDTRRLNIMAPAEAHRYSLSHVRGLKVAYFCRLRSLLLSELCEVILVVPSKSALDLLPSLSFNDACRPVSTAKAIYQREWAIVQFLERHVSQKCACIASVH